MELQLAELHAGIERLVASKPKRDLQWRYYGGEHERPYAPPGASEDYMELREMSRLPLVRLAVRTPCQRLRVKSIIMKDEAAAKEHARIWQANRRDSQQRTPYVHGLVYGEGIVSVWPNSADPTTPLERNEDPNLVWIERDPNDPLRILWSIKSWTERHLDQADNVYRTRDVGVVYHDDQVWRYHRARTAYSSAGWDLQPGFPVRNPMGVNPMTPYNADLDSRGRGASLVDPLIPMQRAIDTMRFDLLLAAQFAAYRQRVATGYDPILRDKDGVPVWQKDKDGELILDEFGQPRPIVRSPGKVGVDRLLAFPGIDTKIFDLAESNLLNYVGGLEMLVSTFSSTAQVPAAYMMGDFKNVSGDLMVATEATLRSLIKDLQTSYGESDELVRQKIALAAGREDLYDVEAETEWEETGPVDLNQIAQFAAQMVPLGYPLRSVVERIPGVTAVQAARLELTPPQAPAGEPSGTDTPGVSPESGAPNDGPPA